MRFMLSLVSLLLGAACIVFALAQTSSHWLPLVSPTATVSPRPSSSETQPFAGRILRGGDAMRGTIVNRPQPRPEATEGTLDKLIDAAFSRTGLSIGAFLLTLLLLGRIKRHFGTKSRLPPPRPRPKPKQKTASSQRVRQKLTFPQVVIDGSNVLYWGGEEPDINTLKSVIDTVHRQGYEPIIWFDANVGYKISDRYLGPNELAHILRLTPRQIYVTEKGTQADPYILEMAAQLSTTVISKDQYRDFEATHPWIREPGRRLGGHMKAADFGIYLPPRHP